MLSHVTLLRWETSLDKYFQGRTSNTTTYNEVHPTMASETKNATQSNAKGLNGCIAIQLSFSVRVSK